jgi:hypothetical protein
MPRLDELQDEAYRCLAISAAERSAKVCIWRAWRCC